MDNPEKRATWGTQDEGAIKNRQSRETVNKRQRIPKGQSKIDNPEKLQINVREYRRGNQ